MSLPVPPWAPTILTGPPSKEPSPAALKLLRSAVKSHLQSDKPYSVTYSPLLCPAGKNFLYTLKPYYWEVSPGKWEYRDGQRNPYCDRATGQSELQNMSMAVYILGLSARYLPELATQSLQRVVKILTTFFIDENTKVDPRVEYAQTNPSISPPKGDQGFVVAIRYLVLVSQSLQQLLLDTTLQNGLRSWFAEHLSWMENSPQGEMAKANGNNLSFWYHANVVSALHVNSSAEAANAAEARLGNILTSHPTPDSLFARELSRTRPRHYVLFALEPLFILASFISANGSPIRPAFVAYLNSAVEYAAAVQPGAIERPLEEEGRYEAQLAWFQRMLSRWKGENLADTEPDGKGWEKGWNIFARLEWALI